MQCTAIGELTLLASFLQSVHILLHTLPVKAVGAKLSAVGRVESTRLLS